MKPAGWVGPYQPRAWPTYLATMAPAMPRIVVKMRPILSLPGLIARAMSPITKPMMIVQRMCMGPPSVQLCAQNGAPRKLNAVVRASALLRDAQDRVVVRVVDAVRVERD